MTSQKDGATRALRSVQKPKKASGLTVTKAAGIAAESVCMAPADKVPVAKKCTNISQEVVQIGADNLVDRICKAKPSSNTDLLRSQAGNCSLLDADLRSSLTSSTDNVQDIDSREESIFQ